MSAMTNSELTALSPPDFCPDHCKEVIADYTGKKPQRLWRSRIALAGTPVLLAALFWFSPYQEIALSKINLAKVMQFITPSVVSRRSLPQGTPAAVRDVLLPVSPSTPALPTQPPTLTIPPPSPEVSEPSTAVPATVRTVKKGDQIARVALEVYGSSNSADLDWIRKNNPQLQNLNRVEVGMQLTLPPLPAGIR